MTLPKLKLPLKLLVPLLAIALFSVYSFAASITVTTTTIQNENGVYFNVVGGFTVASNGFAVVQATGTATTLPATWANGGIVQTALTAGNWYYNLTLTANAAATASTTYNVTVTWNTGSGYSALGSLRVTLPASGYAGQSMTLLIDTQLQTFNAPAAMTITVA
jgi:hypothetical protein